MDPRAGEDAVSMLFNALEDLANSASSLSRKIMMSFYLLLAWLALALVLWFMAVIDLNLWDILAYVFLIVVVIVVMIYLVEIREKLAITVGRYQAYEHIKNVDLSIPDGRDEVERFLNYLNKNFQFEERIRKRGGRVEKNVEISGIKFDLYAEIPKRVFSKITGVKSYAFFLAVMDKPTLGDVRRIVDTAVEHVKRRNLEIGRISIIAREISDEVYEKIMDFEVPVQVVVEMEDGTYDFIPFIGPRPDMLP